MHQYCQSRYKTIRRQSREVYIGNVGIGGQQPIRLQSMTTTNTQDVDATVKQAISLVDAGCEIVRITAPNKAAAQALEQISAKLRAEKIEVPLVADIHFLPSAAMVAVEHVEKVRINPGNYADSKKFATKEYSDNQYDEELQRLHDSFSPLVIRSKELGRAMRIGTNHGSLSDRIMNRYGDTPLGMVESALEFLRIAESHRFKDIALSMKASNPKVMIEAYRMLVERMDAEEMHYPLHLGVTEAGDGEDGRIKSAIGIGSLLMDGLGDTIRVSLTEDPEHEIPVASAVADKVMSLWGQLDEEKRSQDTIDPYDFNRRPIESIDLGVNCLVNTEQPPRVIAKCHASVELIDEIVAAVDKAIPLLKDTPLEGLIYEIKNDAHLDALTTLTKRLREKIEFFVASIDSSVSIDKLRQAIENVDSKVALHIDARNWSDSKLETFLELCFATRATPILGLCSDEALKRAAILRGRAFIATLDQTTFERSSDHTIGTYRLLVESLKANSLNAPIWIRNTYESAIQYEQQFLSRLLEGSILSGSLLCDGIGDLISIETGGDLATDIKLAYNVLQGAGARITKTEFVACPSCGRTLFDLQSTTQRIREKTGHLKGVKIAIMGCIVNGPGEMADADFGYVGGAPAKINLYVGKKCVKFNIPQAEADERLIDLIREHGKWVEPELVPSS